MQKIVLAAVAALAILPVAANAGEVQNRINNQQARINQGAVSGSLTNRQDRRLDNSLDRIQNQRNRDLRANGGTLRPGQYHRLNREENRLSNRIYSDKHS